VIGIINYWKSLREITAHQIMHTASNIPA